MDGNEREVEHRHSEVVRVYPALAVSHRCQMASDCRYAAVRPGLENERYPLRDVTKIGVVRR